MGEQQGSLYNETVAVWKEMGRLAHEMKSGWSSALENGDSGFQCSLGSTDCHRRCLVAADVAG